MRIHRAAPFFRLLACLALTGLLAGSCLGRAPAPSILRLDVPTLSSCEGVADDRLIMLRGVSAPENLDRPAVLVADGLVLSPSQQWYWEAAPGDLLTQALLAALPCVDGARFSAPYHPRVPHEGVVSGQLKYFEVQTSGSLRLRVGLELSYAQAGGSGARIGTTLSAERPMSELSAAAAARAASEAVTEICAQARDYLAKSLPQRASGARPASR